MKALFTLVRGGLTTVFLIALFLSPASLFAGVKVVGNGGADIALEFSTSASHAIQRVRANLTDFPEIDPKRLEELLAQASLVPVDTDLVIEKDGRQHKVTAANHHDPDTILINTPRWNLVKNETIREALGLHELLGLAGLEGTGDYHLSQRYLAHYGYRCGDGLCDVLPEYNCHLIKNLTKIPEYLQTRKMGGQDGTNSLELRSGPIRVTVIANAMPTEFLVMIYDRETKVSSVELPLSALPHTLRTSWRQSDTAEWTVQCNRP